jgi:polar amino acid transport system permease protein
LHWAELAQNRFVRVLSSVTLIFSGGTPLLVQIFLIYFGIPQLFSFTLPITISILPVCPCFEFKLRGVYGRDLPFRDPIIDYGQTEAARSLGMSHFQAMRYIILPQAFKVVVPPLGNEFIAMLKDSLCWRLLPLKKLMYTERS